MKKILIAFLIVTLPCFAIIEDKKISLNDAINCALETNPQIKMRKLDVDSSVNDIKIASRLQNPSITTFQNIGETGQGNPQQIGADYTIELLKRGKRKTKAQSDSYIISDNQKFQEYKLILEVKRAYIDFLLKKTNLKLIEEQKQLTKELLDTTNKQYSEKTASKTDTIEARIAYNRSVIYSNIAKSALISSQNRFNSVMNSSNVNYDTKEDVLDDNYKKLLTINPKDNSLTFEKIKNYTLNSRLDLLAAKQAVLSAQYNLDIVKSNLIPDIELSGGYGYLTKGLSDVSRFQSGAYIEASLVNIPLVYRYQPEIKNAKNDIEKAQLKLQDLEIDITRNITDAWERYTIAKNNLNFYNDELLADSKELLEASKQGLNKKELDTTGYIVSKKLYLELILGYYETLAEYYISYAELLCEMNAVDIEQIENL